MGEDKRSVVMKVGYAKDHRVVHADSALGGPTPRGEFRLEFATTLPPPVVRNLATIDGDGKIIEQKLESESQELLMERQVTVVMSQVAAKHLLDLLAGLLKENG